MGVDPLSKRARAVLYAVVTEYLATGEPVGSRTLTRKHGFDLSAATIRNVLADLEDAGFLAQPHTSAGRVPTEAALRLFIDALMRVRELSVDEAARIREWFEDQSPGADLARASGRLLADLTGSAAVVVRPRVEARTLLNLRFVPARPGELVGVLVFGDGSVENRFVHVDRPLGASDLERLHNVLEEIVPGRTVSEVRDHLADVVSQRRDELAALLEVGARLVGATVERGDRGADVIIEGRARLLERAAPGQDAAVRGLLQALEERERLVALVEELAATERVQVFLGNETGDHVGFPVSVVAARYQEEDGRPAGAVGVIGPARMDYPSVVPIVGATADALTQALARSREGRHQD